MTNRKGLTLVEVLLVITILAVLSSFTGFTLLRSRNKVSLDGIINQVIQDVKTQQLQTMSGLIQGGISNRYYGIHFENTRYILFHTPTYQANDATNYAINLEADSRFSVINLPNNEILFADAGGEIEGFDPIRNFVTIDNINSDLQKTLYFNIYGTVYEIN